MAYDRIYKLSDDLSIDQTYDTLLYNYRIEIDTGVEFEAIEATYQEVLDGIIHAFATYMQMPESEIAAMLSEVIGDNESYLDYFAENSNLVQTNRWVGEAGSMFTANLIKVLVEDDYLLSHQRHHADDPNAYTVHLTPGWYTVAHLRDSQATYYPVGFATIKKIEEKFLPDSYQDLKKIAPYIDIEVGDVSNYDTTKSYILGEVCKYGNRQYKCIVEQTQVGEFNENDWEEADVNYYYLYYRGISTPTGKVEITYDDFISHYEQGKQFRLWLGETEDIVYFDSNYFQLRYDDGFRTLHLRANFEGIQIDLYVPNNREHLPDRNIPYMTGGAVGAKYVIIDRKVPKDLICQYIRDKIAIAYQESSSSSVRPIIESEILPSYVIDNVTYTNVPQISYKSGSYLITLTICEPNKYNMKTSVLTGGISGQIMRSDGSSSIWDTFIKLQNDAPTYKQSIWVTKEGQNQFSVKLNLENEWIEIGNTSAMWCTLTESNNVYSCDKTPQEIYKAFMAGTPVYIKYMGLPIPVVNAVYNQQDDEYYINATITTVVGEELLGRQIGFDGTTWSIDFNDSFIVRGAGSLANIGKYLKATANGVMWDTPEGGGGTVDALDTEEMMELFADTGLTETAGLEYNEYAEDAQGDYIYDDELGNYRLLDQSDPDDFYVEDEEGDYVYDETLHEYRPYVEGDTGTRYSLRQRYDYVDSGLAGYVEYVEDKNGDYVWDEDTQTYILLDTTDPDAYYVEDEEGDYVYDETLHEYRLYVDGDTGTRYSLRTRYSVGDTYLITY